METGMNKLEYDRVFVLAGEMEKANGNYKFLKEDKCGFIHGETRLDAIKILKKQSKVKKIIFVGGPVKNDKTNKAELMKRMMDGDAEVLESKANTKDNIRVIKEYLDSNQYNEEENGLLTHFYHLPRVLRLVKDKGFKLTPICAEAVLLTEKPSWVEKIKEWYRQPSMVDRIYWEIQGLSDREEGKY